MEKVQYICKKEGSRHVNIWKKGDKKIELTLIDKIHKDILEKMIFNTEKRLTDGDILIQKSELNSRYNIPNIVEIALVLFNDLLKKYINNIINECINKSRKYMITDLVNHIFDCNISNIHSMLLEKGFIQIMYEAINNITINCIGLNDFELEELEIKYNLVFIEKTSSTNATWEINGRKINLYLFNNEELKKSLLVLFYLIETRLKNKMPLIDNVNALHYLIGIESTKNIEKISVVIFYDLLSEYLQFHASVLTKNRIIINKNHIRHAIFPLALKRETVIISNRTNREFLNIVERVTNDEFQKQLQIFPKINLRTDLESDLWILYKRAEGKGLNEYRIDFTKVKKPSLRVELKTYIRQEFEYGGDYKKLYDKFIWIVKALNYFADNYSNVLWCADIRRAMIFNLREYLKREAYTENNTNKKLAVKSQAKVMQKCTKFFDFLTRFPELKTPRPTFNPFNGIGYHDLRNVGKNTEIISETVVNGLLDHIEDLREDYQKILLISLNTGMRAKEVIYLEENCLSFVEEEEVWKLEFIPWKVLESRRMANLEDYVFVVIKEELVKEIQEQIKLTEGLRKELKSKRIFLYAKNRIAETIKLPDSRGFNNAVNKLIKKYNITDENEELAHFHHRQCRKLLAVTMIENGATPREVSKQLNHSNDETTNKFYNEVRKIKLADLNSDFYRKKFNLLITEEQLSRYTEDERKLLYVGFCTDYRDVELGKCMKSFSEGKCRREGDEKVSCATCPNLCVNINSLEKWVKLEKSKEKTILELKKFYEKQEINESEYKNYREYQRELYLINAYKDVIAKIKNMSFEKSERNN